MLTTHVTNWWRKQELEVCVAEMIHLFWNILYVWQAMRGKQSVSHLWDPRKIRHFPLEQLFCVYTLNIHNFRYGFMLPLLWYWLCLLWWWLYDWNSSGNEACLAIPGWRVTLMFLSENCPKGQCRLSNISRRSSCFEPRFFRSILR